MRVGWIERPAYARGLAHELDPTAKVFENFRVDQLVLELNRGEGAFPKYFPLRPNW